MLYAVHNRSCKPEFRLVIHNVFLLGLGKSLQSNTNVILICVMLQSRARLYTKE